MNKEKLNEKAINDVYKNAHIALQSLEDLIPSVPDKSLKAELNDEYRGYKKLIDEISSYMKKNKLSPKDINPFKKTMLRCSIKMKTVMNNSRNQVAEMMINGTVMGIIELTAMKNEGSNLKDEVKGFVENLLSLEEKYQENLKKFL